MNFLMFIEEEYIKKRAENYHTYSFKNIFMVFRKDGNGVIADIVMKFKFSRNNNGASMKSRIESVIQQMQNNSGNLEINLSTEITCKYHFYIPFYFTISLNLTSYNSCFNLMRD